MGGSEFVFDDVHLFYYKCHKKNVYHGGSYIDFPDWIKNKKATINPINKRDNKCFQCAVTVTLIYEEMEKKLQRMTKIKPFINKYSWEEINFPSEKDDRKNLRKVMWQLLLMFCMLKKKNISCLYFKK